MQSDILAAIDVAKSDLVSESGDKSSKMMTGFSNTIASDFSMDTQDVEELR